MDVIEKSKQLVISNMVDDIVDEIMGDLKDSGVLEGLDEDLMDIYFVREMEAGFKSTVRNVIEDALKEGF